MGGGALSSNVSKLGSKEVIRHAELVSASLTHPSLPLEREGTQNPLSSPLAGEEAVVCDAERALQMQERGTFSRNNKTLSRISKFTSFTKKFNPLPEVEGKCAFTLAEGATHVDTCDGKRKIAFTLAEVLITLGIIGVVVALTLPSVIQNYKKQVTVNQLKKAYSTLGQVAQKAFADNGPAGFETGSKLNGDDVKDFFDTYWLPYFKGAQVYPELKRPILNESKGYYADCYLYLNGSYADTHIYTTYDGGRIFFSTADGMTYFVYMITWVNQKYDENGNLISQDGVYASNQRVYVDVNGTKPPNTYGKDVFGFNIDFNNGVVRPVSYRSSQATIDNACKTSGMACTTKIMREGWKINY